MPRSPFVPASILISLLAGPAFAQSDLTTEPVALAATQTSIVGKVMVVNTETRLMTVKVGDGSYVLLHVPPEVERIDRIKIGNRVEVSETTSTLIALEKGADAGAIGAEGATLIDREPGEKPAGTITDVLTVRGQVVGIDKAAGTVTIQGPEAVRTFEVEDVTLLDDLAVGDGVVANFLNVISGRVTFD
ncbi:copper-binding protein [Thiohalocapsa marina]|uniref:Copper-binding protein n=1 Tax=Thiohalocapsa marina TaxID=424902 RepID=A0A5M8FTE3_9GAMM|nr:copper-binding protein [Thiohalocapsa marina]KAA6187060.1 copper-binding protein [Thiohalocapsa marina]